MTSVIVIGAGIGGIATAARLARRGYAVTVLEKGQRPGGRVSTLEQAGFRFDTGPTLFLMPEVFAETYAALGEKMQDHLHLERIDPVYRIHFNDHTTLDLSSVMERMRYQLEAYEPGVFEAFLKFMAEGARNYRLSLEHFVGRNFTSLSQYFNPHNLPLIFQMKALRKHFANTAGYFKDPRLQAAFTFQNMYLGVSPFDAPATFNLLQYTELGDGVWFPRGGMYQVITSLVEIAQGLGVHFRYNAQVARIDVEGRRATGVTLEDGQRLKADILVANADLPYVYQQLLPPDRYSSRLMKKKFTSSALMFYWGVRGERSPALLHHNVFLADHRYRQSFEQIFNDLSLPEEPSFYVCAPTRTDPGFAPADGDSLMVLVPVGHMDDRNSQPWDELFAKARQTVIERLTKLGLKDLEKRIVFEARWGPPYYRDELNLMRGAAFGLSHNFTQVGYLRPHNRHARYGNLYFAGASTHPGTGLPIVLLSAQLTVDRILKEQAVVLKPSFPVGPQIVEQV